MQTYSTQFTLTREYLAECFDQSLPHGKNAKPNYFVPVFFFAVGSGLLNFTDQPEIAGWMLIALGVLEVLHIRYRRAWWLARQMWGSSANSEVTLTIDDEGIRTQSSFVQTSLLWIDIERVIETNLGHLLVDKAGAQQYLSKSLMPTGLIDEMVALHQP
jgi:hypothetical protein